MDLSFKPKRWLSTNGHSTCEEREPEKKKKKSTLYNDNYHR